MVAMPSGAEPDSELLRVWREPAADGVIVHVAGEIDLVTAPRLARELGALERQPSPPARLVLDLTEVAFVASVGLSTLLDHDERCREAGIALRIVTGNRTVSRAVTLTGLTDTLTVFDTLDEAITAAP